jgi:hypothetical protein
MAGNVAPNTVTDGLVLYLDAANTKSYISGSSNWNDLSGNGFNGTLTNGPTFSTSVGGTIVLDGVDDYTSIDNTVLSTLTDDNSLTVGILVNINEPTLSTRGGLICNQKYSSETDAGGFGFVIESGGIIAVNLTKEIGGVKTAYEVLSSFYMNRQQYAFYTFTYNSSTKTVITYKNAIQQASSTNASYGWTKNTTNRPTRIGINTQGGWGAYYKMNIINASIYNRALSQAEILQNYNATKGRYNL